MSKTPASLPCARRARGLRALTGAAVAAAAVLTAASALALDVGQRAPDLSQNDLDGNRVTLEGLRGNVVLVNFMASWCEPCGAEMGVLERLYQRYRQQGLRIVAVSQDSNMGNLRSFLRGHPVTFPVILDRGQQISSAYSPPTMPSSYILDRNGIVRHVHAGYRSGSAQAFERDIRALLTRR